MCSARRFSTYEMMLLMLSMLLVGFLVNIGVLCFNGKCCVRASELCSTTLLFGCLSANAYRVKPSHRVSIVRICVRVDLQYINIHVVTTYYYVLAVAVRNACCIIIIIVCCHCSICNIWSDPLSMVMKGVLHICMLMN